MGIGSYRATCRRHEDAPAILNMTKLMLERCGYQVYAASAAGEAIRMVEECESKIDLLVTDVIMPEMNGGELAKHVTTVFPEIRKLFMSGYSGEIIAKHGVLDESVNFIQKPFSLRALAGKVREALDRE